MFLSIETAKKLILGSRLPWGTLIIGSQDAANVERRKQLKREGAFKASILLKFIIFAVS